MIVFENFRCICNAIIRTVRKLIQIKINQPNNPDQKPDYKLCFLSIYTRIYSFILYFAICIFGQCAIYSWFILSLNRGIFYISFQSARCPRQGMRSTHTLTSKSTPPKSHTLSTSPHPKIV